MASLELLLYIFILFLLYYNIYTYIYEVVSDTTRRWICDGRSPCSLRLVPPVIAASPNNRHGSTHLEIVGHVPIITTTSRLCLEIPNIYFQNTRITILIPIFVPVPNGPAPKLFLYKPSFNKMSKV